jgi:hypothetical protein
VIEKQLLKAELLDFFTITKEYLEHTIEANKRSDDLYHSYNLMTLTNDSEVAITYLPEMLEGQVAVLSARVFIFKRGFRCFRWNEK